MKVKNIAFSGFAAAILMGVCGAAQAAGEPLKIASQAYVVKQVGMKQDKLTAANQGEGIKLNMDEDGNLANISVDWQSVASNQSVKEQIGDAITEGEQFKEAVGDAIDEAVATGAVGNAISSAVNTAVSGINDKIGDANGGMVKDIADAAAAAAAAQGAADAAQGAADAAAQAAEAAQEKADSAYLLADAAQTADEVSGAIDAKINGLNLDTTYAGKATTEQGIQDAKDAASAADTKAGNAAAAAEAAQGAADAAAQAAQAAQTKADSAYTLAEAAQTAQQVSNAIDAKINGLNLDTTYAGKAATEQGIQDAKDAAKAAQDDVDALELVVADKADSSTVSGLADTVAANKKAVEDANYMSGNNINAGSYLMLSDGKGGITWSSIAIVDENGDVLTLSSDAPSSEPAQPGNDA